MFDVIELPVSSPNRNKYKQKLQQKRFMTKLMNRALWDIKDVWRTWPWSTLKLISWNWLWKTEGNHGNCSYYPGCYLQVSPDWFWWANRTSYSAGPGGKAAGVCLCRHLTSSVPPLSKRYERLSCFYHSDEKQTLGAVLRTKRQHQNTRRLLLLLLLHMVQIIF